MRKKITAAIVLGAALLAPATASASYNTTQGQAEVNAMDAAEYRYAANGVDATGAWCYPQGHFTNNMRIPGYWHRWVCTWVGTDDEDSSVYGHFRITGHTGNRYGYLPLMGGLRWDE